MTIYKETPFQRVTGFHFNHGPAVVPGYLGRVTSAPDPGDIWISFSSYHSPFDLPNNGKFILRGKTSGAIVDFTTYDEVWDGSTSGGFYAGGLFVCGTGEGGVIFNDGFYGLTFEFVGHFYASYLARPSPTTFTDPGPWIADSGGYGEDVEILI